ncbi:MAG: hypothetical protein OHK0032_10100 [Thermodesulfovibrionales bacterium]
MLFVAIASLGAILLCYAILASKKIKGITQRLEDEQKKVRELAILNDISSLLYKDLDSRSIIETIVDKAKELIRSEYSALLLLEEGKVTGFYTSIGEASACQTEASGILARVINEGIPARGRNAGELEGFMGFPETHNIKSILVAPVLLRNEIIGELILANRFGSEEFSFRDEDLLLTLGFHAAFAMEKARHHQEIARLANIDGLTGLNNHRTFQERLEMEVARAKRYKHNMSLLMMDIDNFKKFNDTYGHRVGDEVLKRVACRVTESIRNVDFAARYGGEEFAVILPETPLDGAVVTAEKIREAVMNHKIMIDNRDISSVTISIGVAAYPEDATERESLIEKADKALYAAKKASRNRVCSFRDIPPEY